MADNSAQATTYAQAALQALVEHAQTTLNQAADALDDNSIAAKVTNSSSSVDDRVRALVGSIASTPSIEESNLLKLVVQSGDTGMLRNISAALSQTLSGDSGPQQAEVTSAVELTDQEKDAIRRKLTAENGGSLMVDFDVDDSLLGGLRVRIGDRLIDNSVATRLTNLRESLSSVVQ